MGQLDDAAAAADLIAFAGLSRRFVSDRTNMTIAVSRAHSSGDRTMAHMNAGAKRCR
jgi:hypothetical protein